MNLAGIPRLDLVVTVHGKQASLDTSGIRHLDDGLEPEPGTLATAPVVLTLVRARDDTLFPPGDPRDANLATHADIFLLVEERTQRIGGIADRLPQRDADGATAPR